MGEISQRVLIIDDQTIFRELLAEVLSIDRSVEVVAQLEGGNDALRIVRETRPNLVVLDLILPDRSGIDVLKELMDAQPSLKVLLVTGHARPEVVRRAIELGAKGSISKSAALQELRQAVSRVLAGGRYFCSATSEMLATSIQNHESAVELTARQREILLHVAQGSSSKEIAAQLNISQKTVENHRLQIRQKLGITDIAGLTRYAVEQGLIEAKS